MTILNNTRNYPDWVDGLLVLRALGWEGTTILATAQVILSHPLDSAEAFAEMTESWKIPPSRWRRRISQLQRLPEARLALPLVVGALFTLNDQCIDVCCDFDSRMWWWSHIWSWSPRWLRQRDDARLIASIVGAPNASLAKH